MLLYLLAFVFLVNASPLLPNTTFPLATTAHEISSIWLQPKAVDISAACFWDTSETPPDWTCDFKFPTIDEIMFHMLKENGGSVTSDTVPLFYSGWASKNPTIGAVAWAIQWLRSQQSVEPYWYPPALNRDWFVLQGHPFTGAHLL